MEREEMREEEREGLGDAYRLVYRVNKVLEAYVGYDVNVSKAVFRALRFDLLDAAEALVSVMGEDGQK